MARLRQRLQVRRVVPERPVRALAVEVVNDGRDPPAAALAHGMVAQVLAAGSLPARAITALVSGAATLVARSLALGLMLRAVDAGGDERGAARLGAHLHGAHG